MSNYTIECDECGEVSVSTTTVIRCPKCGSKRIHIHSDHIKKKLDEEED
jgi:Zn finger protein HypA/HybF involved in hydrogenase expression